MLPRSIAMLPRGLRRAATQASLTTSRQLHLHSTFHPTSTAPPAASRLPLLLLHGLLGNSSNLKTLSSSLHKEQPASSPPPLILDTRGHGASPPSADTPADTPSDLPHCGRDVAETVCELTSSRGVSVVVGHSFGGKQALAYLNDVLTFGQCPPPEAVWLLDTMPGAVPRTGENKQVSG